MSSWYILIIRRFCIFVKFNRPFYFFLQIKHIFTVKKTLVSCNYGMFLYYLRVIEAVSFTCHVSRNERGKKIPAPEMGNSWSVLLSGIFCDRYYGDANEGICIYSYTSVFASFQWRLYRCFEQWKQWNKPRYNYRDWCGALTSRKFQWSQYRCDSDMSTMSEFY